MIAVTPPRGISISTPSKIARAAAEFCKPRMRDQDIGLRAGFAHCCSGIHTSDDDAALTHRKINFHSADWPWRRKAGLVSPNNLQ